MDADEVAARLGSFEWEATAAWTVSRAKEPKLVHLAERHRVRQASSGEFEVQSDLDPGWLVGSSSAETARTWAAQEKERLLAALKAAGGRIYGPGGAAHRLGLKPTTLYGKMRKHCLKRDADWT